MTFCRSPRVFASSVLKSWSRSTTDVGLRRRRAWRRRRARSLVSGRERERDVAVGDARQRGQPDHRLRALAQRRVGLLDLDLDRGLVVVGQLDRAHGADPPAADLHVVVLDELAGGLEEQRVLVAAAARGTAAGSRRAGRRGRAPAARSRRAALKPSQSSSSATFPLAPRLDGTGARTLPVRGGGTLSVVC